MHKFKYLKLNKYKKIRYLSVIPENKIYIVFLHGFMSDLEGEKPKDSVGLPCIEFNLSCSCIRQFELQTQAETS